MNTHFTRKEQKFNNDDINKNFISVFPSDNKLINFHLAVKAKDAKYPFLVSKTHMIETDLIEKELAGGEF